jgi:Ca-activated chloride channel family protein
MPRTRWTVLATLLPALGAVLLSRPATAQKVPVFGSGIDLVNVTVTVRDAHGNLVSDLKPEDFVVYEDGRPQNVQLFAPAAAETGGEEAKDGQKALGLNLGMLLDTSESMKAQIKLTQESAVRFLESIPRARDLLLIFFDQDIRLSRYSSENQQGLFERIAESKGSGNTALYDAISVYVSRVADVPGRKVLVIFTDGEDSTSAITLAECLALVRSSGVTVYPIAFTMGSFGLGSNRYVSARAFLGSLAESSGGQVYSPAASKDLSAIYKKILDELASQYVLGFVSDNPAMNGKFRKLRVDVKPASLRVRHRVGYYAVPGGKLTLGEKRD